MNTENLQGMEIPNLQKYMAMNLNVLTFNTPEITRKIVQPVHCYAFLKLKFIKIHN